MAKMVNVEMEKNFNQLELEKFEKYADSWWNINGNTKALHKINPLRLNWMKNISGGFYGKSVLDVGCGGGILSEEIAKSGGLVTGIDLSEKLIEIAKLHKKKSKVQVVDYYSISPEAFAKQNLRSYDVVVCMEVLEHVPKPISIIKSCSDLVKPGGWIFFSTFNRNLKSFLFGILGAEYVLNLLPRGTHTYSAFIRPSELSKLVRETNLHPVKIKGLSYNPLKKKFFLSNDVSVNYLLAARK